MFRFLIDLPLGALRAFSELFEWILVSLVPGQGSPDDAPRPWWKTILLLPVLLPLWAFQIGVGIIAFPFAAVSFEGERRRHFLLGLPSLVGMVAAIVAVTYVWFTHDSIDSRYVTLMQTAMKQGDYQLASTLGGRLLADAKDSKPDITFMYAQAVGQSGDLAKATSIINSMAPNKMVGYPSAHRMRALQLAQTIGANPTDEQLNNLRWHLTNSGAENDEQILMLWAAYYERMGQLDEAIKKVDRASKLNRMHCVALSEMYRRAGRELEASRELAGARDHLRRMVEGNPHNKSARIQLALILAKLSQLEDAERVLLNGLQIFNDKEIQRATADYYLLRYDLGLKEPNGLTRSFDYLERAIRLDPGYLPIYSRLVQLYGEQQASKDKESGESIVKLLEELIVDGKNAATAHFALSSILLIDGKSDEAILHLRQSFQLSPNMPVVCNNLAWMLAHSKPPRLDEALQLSELAVKEVPNVVGFRDTLGTIYLMQERFMEAIKELEIVLSERPDDKGLHQKLATAYEAVGNQEIAKLHLQKSQ